MSRGFFVTFEGLDGSGKSTQLRRLKEWLESHALDITTTRQPGGTRLGDRLRSLLLDSQNGNLAPMTELGLMFSDRAQSIAEIIEPALEAGHVVLCDRFTDSSEAYQGGGRQLGSAVVRKLHEALCGGLQPDLTLLLLPDFELSLKRARQRNERSKARTGVDENRFETETSLFYQRVFEKFEEIAAREPERVVSIDGNGSIDDIHAAIVRVVEPRLRKAGILPPADQ